MEGKYLIINFLDKPISFYKFMSTDIDMLNLNEKYKRIVKEIVVQIPKKKYYTFTEDYPINDQTLYFFNFNEIVDKNANFLNKLIYNSVYIACITDDQRMSKSYIDNINSKCVLEIFNERSCGLLSILFTLKCIYSVDISNIYIHY